MSEVVLKWLNSDIGLSRPIQKFEADFANGFLLGELLHKHGLLEEFRDRFVDENSYAAQSANFAHLKAALRGPAGSLGVQLRDEQVREIMGGDRGSSLRFLFQLRKGLEKSGAKAHQVGGGARRKEPQQDETRAPRVRQQHDAKQEHFFESRLKPLKRSEKRVAYELHSKPFADEHLRQMAAATKGYAREVEATLNETKAFRDSRLATMRDSRAAKEQVKAVGQQTWVATVQRKVDMVGKDLRFEKEMIKREYDRVDRVREGHQQDTGYREGDDHHGIAWFERNLTRLGIDTSEHAGSTEATIEAANAKELYEKMQEKLPAKAQLQVESAAKMKEIRNTKEAGDLARKEREQRQRRVQVEQQATQASVEEQRNEEEVLAWLAKEAVEYRTEAMAFDQKQRYKDALCFQRKTRQEERANVLATRSEEATARMVEEAQQDRERILEEKRAKEQMLLRLETGSLDLQEAQGLFSEEEDTDEDDDHLELDPLTGSWGPSRPTTMKGSSKDTMKATLPEVAPAPPEELLACVKEERTSEYVFGRGIWGRYQLPEDSVRVFLQDRAAQAREALPRGPWQPRLGSLARWLCASEPLPGAEAELPADYLPILAIGGSPAALGGAGGLAGKVARRLAEKFELAVVDPQAVLEECLALAQAQEPEEEWPPLARLRSLGRGLMAALQESGQEVPRPTSSSPTGARGPVSPFVPIPHEHFAEMLFRKIELLSSPPPKPVEEEEIPDPKRKKTPPKAKGKKEEEEAPPKRPNGIIISGFPTELAGNAAWESALRGYSSPLLRIMDGAEDMQVQLGAILAPWWSLAAQGDGEGPEASSHLLRSEVLEAGQRPMRLLNLNFPDHGARSETLVRLAGEEHARLQEALSGNSPSRGGTAPADKKGKAVAEEPSEPSPAELAKVFACRGYELEQTNLTSVLDRAWLYDEAQILAQAFDAHVGSGNDITAAVEAQPPGASGEGESLEDVCYQQAHDLVARWHGPDQPAQDAEQPAAPAPSEPAADEEMQGGASEEQQPGSEEQELSRATSAGALGSAGVGGAPMTGPQLWLRLGAQARSRLKGQWLDCTSAYFKGVESTLAEALSAEAHYRESLVEMQRNFLEFLQRSDDKGSVMMEFVKTWPARVAKLKPNTHDVVERLEDLSDRLWQFTDHRREEAVCERLRLMEGGFWEGEASSSLLLAERLQNLEQRRFRLSVELLSEAYGLLPPVRAGPDHPGEPVGISSLRELGGWLRSTTDHLIGDPVEVGDSADEGAEAASPKEEVRGAFLAEQLGLVRRLRAVEAWTNARLEVMREQLDEVFRRMDDWIRDRVKSENDAIKAAIDQVRSEDWSTFKASGDLRSFSRSPSLSRSPSRSPHKGAHRSPSMNFRRRRRELASMLEAQALDVEVYDPSELEQAAGSSASAQGSPALQGGALAQALSKAGLGGDASPASAAARPAAPGGGEALGSRGGDLEAGGCGQPPGGYRWSQEMLRGLLDGLTSRSRGSGTLSEAALLEELLARKNETLSLRSQLVPEGWVTRSDDAYRALCRGFAAPGWGVAEVDVTEVVLALSFHCRPVSWPTLQALEASRQMLESGGGAAAEGQEPGAVFPDVQVGEATFLQMPLWDEDEEPKLQQEANESFDDWRQWILEALSRFDAAARPASPARSPRRSPAASRTRSPARSRTASRAHTPAARTSSRADTPAFSAATSPARATSRAASPAAWGFAGASGPERGVSARRLFAYLGAALVPTEGLQRALRLLMPTPPAERMSEEGTLPHEVRVQDLWTVLFSRGARPPAALAPAPDLADFCREIAPPPAPVEPDPPEVKGKAAKGKAAGKKAPAQPEVVEEAEPVPPTPPEEVTVPMLSQDVERHPAVLRGLCSHGGVLCRRRALEALFSEGSPTPPLATFADASEARGLPCLIPAPPEAAAGEEAAEES